MKLKIYEDRKVYIEKRILGINNENKATTCTTLSNLADAQVVGCTTGY